MSFHQSGDMTVPGAANQVTLPMAGDGAILDFRRPFSNGNGIDDLTLVVSTLARVPRTADPPLGPQVLNQLFFQRSTRLNEQGYDKWFRATRACSRPRDTHSSAIRKPVPATNPESVYPQRSLAALRG
jgi:hypothetical protein